MRKLVPTLVLASFTCGCGTVSEEFGDHATNADEAIGSTESALEGCSTAFYSANQYYTIWNKYTQMVADVRDISSQRGAKIQQWTYTPSVNQYWTFSTTSDGYTMIRARFNGLVWDVQDVSYDDGADVQQWSATPSENQKWCFLLQPDGSYLIKAKHSGKYAETRGGRGAPIEQYTRNERATAQQWYVRSEPCTTIDTSIDYKLITPSGLVADTQDHSTSRDAEINQWNDTQTRSQVWNFRSVGDDHYVIVSKYTGLVWDIENVSTQDHANVHQWNYVPTDNQKWCLMKDSSNGYQLVVKHSHKVARVRGGDIRTGAIIEQGSFGNPAASRWIIKKTCAEGQVLYQNTCQASCPIGWYDGRNHECQRSIP